MCWSARVPSGLASSVKPFCLCSGSCSCPTSPWLAAWLMSTVKSQTAHGLERLRRALEEKECSDA